MSKNIVLFKYYPPERLDVLEKRMIYFAHPSLFNDPFELQPYFERPLLSEWWKLIDSGQLFVESGMMVNRLPEIMERERHPQVEQDKVSDLHKHTLIFSTSQDGDNILLWAHYSAGHSGFAIGFKSDEPSFCQRLDGQSRNLKRVNYSYLRPTADTADELREQELLLTKSHHWLYEREWRMFESPFNADENEPVRPGVWGFRLEPKSVERIVLGARISEATEDRIRSVLGQPEFKHVTLVRAYLDEKEFGIKHRLIDL